MKTHITGSRRPLGPAQAKARCRRVIIHATAQKRSVVILPGLGNAAGDYLPLSESLTNDYGMNVAIASVARIDWARNAAGLLDGNYWSGNLNPRPTVDWYLERIQSAVDTARSTAEGAPITLLAHSAGGWLGRLYMLDFGIDGIDQFVSLGSPHLPPPEGVIDQTRGILKYINTNSYGAHHAPEVQYITIAGKYIKGAPLLPLGEGTWAEKVVGAGYQQVCGDATCWGDGVVPVDAAHLENALNLTLDGVYHSPLGAEDVPGPQDEETAMQETMQQLQAAGESVDSPQVVESDDDYAYNEMEVATAAQEVAVPGPRLWYGSPGVLEKWVQVLVNPEEAASIVAATTVSTTA